MAQASSMAGKRLAGQAMQAASDAASCGLTPLVSLDGTRATRTRTQIQKVGANMQNLKKEGKHTVRNENEGRNVIAPSLFGA